MEKFEIRTDLALESPGLAARKPENAPSGVSMTTREKDGILWTQVKIENEEGSRAMGKPIGRYITLEAEGMKGPDVTMHQRVMDQAAQALRELLPKNLTGQVLVVGLGNWNITPDALGPKTVAKVLVTRHLRDTLPKELSGQIRPVAAVSPGVMGITGIETGEIVKGIVEKVAPSLVVCVDALAARSAARINATIQLSDTGLCPGAGVGNARAELSERTLGVPVIAIGVPTVVDAATLVNDTIDRLREELLAQAGQDGNLYKMLLEQEPEDKYNLIVELLSPYTGNLFVTPKEVDAVIDRLSGILANTLNLALHPGLTMEDINRFRD